MTYDEFIEKIDAQTEWANEHKAFDIAFIRSWVCFEKFLSLTFREYALGKRNAYDGNYRVLEFPEDKCLDVFLKGGEKKYIEYIKAIKYFSGHMFSKGKNPYQIIVEDVHKGVFEQMISIRNYIVHESDEARKKYLNLVFNGNEKNFIEPNEHFLKWRDKAKSITCYTYYLQEMKDIAKFINSPIYY